MPKEIRIFFFVIFGFLAFAIISILLNQYLPQDSQIYSNYFIFGIAIVVFLFAAGFAFKIGKSGYEENKRFKAKLLNKENNPKIYNYSMNVLQIIKTDLRALFVFVPLFLITIYFETNYFLSFYKTETEFFFWFGILGNLLVLIYLFTLKFRFAISNRAIYLGYYHLFGHNRRFPISLSKIRKHFIDYSYNPSFGQLIIRTNMGPMGYTNENDFFKIFRPTKMDADLNPTISIRVRNMKDVQVILDKLKIDKSKINSDPVLTNP